MSKKIKAVPYQGTLEQEKSLRTKLAEIKLLPGATMPALQTAQEIFGYLPIEVQKIVAEELGVSLEHVFGVATFYSQFSLEPRGKNQIGVCLGTACYVRGSGKIMDAFTDILGIKSGECSDDGKYSLVATRCIGCCGLAPVLTVNEDVYGNISVDDVGKILAKY